MPVPEVEIEDVTPHFQAGDRIVCPYAHEDGEYPNGHYGTVEGYHSGAVPGSWLIVTFDGRNSQELMHISKAVRA